MSLFVASLVVWCIRTTSVAAEGFSVWRVSLVVLRSTRKDLFRRIKQLGTSAVCPFPTRGTPESVHTMHSMADRQSGVTV